MYSFGAMLSFTIANISLIALRYRYRDAELAYKARPNLRFRGVDWPLFAIFGLFGTAAAWLSITIQESGTRIAGFGWLAAGFALFIVYRKRVLKIPLRADDACAGRDPALAARVPADRGARLRRGERGHGDEHRLPSSPPSGARGSRLWRRSRFRSASRSGRDCPRRKRLGDLLDEAEAIAAGYGISVRPRLVRTRNAAEAIVAEARHHHAEIIVLPTQPPAVPAPEQAHASGRDHRARIAARALPRSPGRRA